MSTGTIIRKATEADTPSLSRICLFTADAGNSAEHLHDFGELPGLLYAVPYAKIPVTCWGFVLEDQGEIVGYVLGSADTRAFESYASEHWWPPLAEKYPPSLAKKPADERYMNLLRNMHTAPDVNIAFSKAHLHIDILPKYQGKGWGRKLIEAAVEYLKSINVAGVWVGMDPRNVNARAFYERLGFKVIGGTESNMGLAFVGP
ncbi:acyl-CoA N-acyltransferase [Hymenopellis radicata]|nr:acyl-CoA N-acyltransferase [Hymenopellis radicata]